MTSPTPSTPIFRRYYGAKYDGSPASADACLAAVSHALQWTWTLAGYDDTGLWVKRCPVNLPDSPSCVTYSTIIGGWIVVDADTGVCRPVYDGNFAGAYSTSSDIAAGGTPGIVSVSLQEEVGAAAVPALLLGGSASVTVQLSNAFPGTSYNVRTRITTGVAVLSTLTITETSRTSSSVTFQITAGAASVAAVLYVDAYRLVTA